MTDANVRIGQNWTAFGGLGQDGFYIKKGGLKGVFGGVGVRGESVEYPHGDGDFELPVFRSSRFVTIEGPCIADSAERLDWYSNVLTGLLAGPDSGRVIFDLPGGVRWGDAQLNGPPEFDITMWGQRADWQLSLKFADPYLYRDAASFAGGSPSFHRGNTKAIPVHTVTGSNGSGYTINGPDGKRFTVTRAVVAGSPHVIDMATGWLTINGVVQTGAVTVSDLWAVPGGAQVTHTIAGSGLTLSTLLRDTFI